MQSQEQRVKNKDIRLDSYMNDRLDLKTPDGVSQNIERIAALFPHCVTETTVERNGIAERSRSIDFDLLRQELSADIVEGPKERYRLEWPGKREAIVTANMPTTNTLRPVREDSVNFDTTENLYIEGDNLEVLKLLQESYLGKIKMIYIDPPYNTGNDFVYRDNFAQNAEEFKADSGMTDELGNRLVANPETAGRYHSDWLTMMYPRLKLARNLLTDDGVIFISIDDNEVHNLRKMCDEVFGEVNFVGQIAVQSNPRGRQSDIHLATVNDHLIIYGRNADLKCVQGAPLTEAQKSEFNFTDVDDEPYRLLGLRQRGSASKREERPDMFFPIYVNEENLKVSIDYISGYQEVLPRKSDGSDGRWMWGKAKCIKDIGYLVAKKIERRGEFDIFVKDYLNKGDEERTRKYTTIWDDKKYNNQFGTQEVKSLLDGDFMSFPKSREFVKSICCMGAKKNSIILDFFSGSATTAHAVMQLNAEDGGNRKFIMVQLPEKTDEKSEAYKAGYKNICEIGKERIRRAGKLMVNDKLLMINEKKEKLEKIVNGKLLIVNGQYAFSDGLLIEETAEKLLEEINHLQLTINHSEIGFRVYRLDTSNMQDVYYRPQDYKQDMMTELFANHIKPDRSADDLVAQVMLDWGLPLSLPIEQTTIADKTVYKVAGNALYCCFDEGIDEEFVKTMVESAHVETGRAPSLPLRIVFHDYAFANDTAKENVRQLLKQLSGETEMRVV